MIADHIARRDSDMETAVYRRSALIDALNEAGGPVDPATISAITGLSRVTVTLTAQRYSRYFEIDRDKRMVVTLIGLRHALWNR